MSRERIWNIVGEGNCSRGAEVYGKAMTCIIILSLIPMGFKENSFVFEVIDYFCAGVFIVDYIVRWSTADFKLKCGWKSFLIYPFTPMAIVDLLTILPTFISLNMAFRSMKLLRVLRVLRVFRLIRYSKSIRLLRAVLVEQRHVLLTMAAFSLAYVLVAALIAFNVEPETFGNYYDAIYWVVVTLTTVGYGDLCPTSAVGKFIAMVSSFMGIVLIAMPSGILTAGMVSELDALKRRAQHETVVVTSEDRKDADDGDGADGPLAGV